MRGNKYDVCIFDWDGTLVNSERHIVDSLTYAADKLSLPQLSYEEKKDIIGLSMHKALETLYPSLSLAGIDQMRSHYAEYFFSVPQDASILFEGVINTLSDLRDMGVRLAVATGKSRHGLDKALISTGLKSFFDIERCADETRSKPDPLMLNEIARYYNADPGSMLMVGDTEYDLEMARNFSVDSVGVSYGVHNKSRLALHKPIAIIDSISELKEHVTFQ
jgi:phosphoglycolate phosphatase